MLTRVLFIVCALAAYPALLVGCSLQQVTFSKTSEPAPRPKSRATALTQEGQRLKAEGFNTQALNVFTQAVEINPAMTEAHLGIGTIYREMARYIDADRAYRNAVRSDPNNFDARYFLGLTYQLRGKPLEAIKSYKLALRIDPNNALANRELGTAYLQSGQPAMAVVYAERAVKLGPESQAGWANLAAAYSLAGEYRKAVDAYRKTLSLGEAELPVLIGLADAHIKLGNYPRAENVLDEVLRQEDSALARERMGLTQFKQRKYEKAVEAYRLALAQSPNDLASLNGLGVAYMAIYLRDGEEDETLRRRGLELWRKSLQLDFKQQFLIDLIARYTEE